MKKMSKSEALSQVVHLFEDADLVSNVDLALANRSVKKARKIAMKFRLKIPLSWKRRFCKHCGCFFVPGKTLRVRTKDRNVVYSCLVCKKFMRFPTK